MGRLTTGTIYCWLIDFNGWFCIVKRIIFQRQKENVFIYVKKKIKIGINSFLFVHNIKKLSIDPHFKMVQKDFVITEIGLVTMSYFAFNWNVVTMANRSDPLYIVGTFKNTLKSRL